MANRTTLEENSKFAVRDSKQARMAEIRNSRRSGARDAKAFSSFGLCALNLSGISYFALGILTVSTVLGVVLSTSGCGSSTGYSNASQFPSDVESVYVEMFDSRSFRRGAEYTFSNALAKRIEVETPYKVVSSRDRADSVMSGQLVTVGESILTLERELGRALEKEVVLTAVVNWKSLKTGKLLINSRTVTAAASYSEFQGQDFTYASAVAANKLAQNVVELMELQW